MMYFSENFIEIGLNDEIPPRIYMNPTNVVFDHPHHNTWSKTTLVGIMHSLCSRCKKLKFLIFERKKKISQYSISSQVFE